MRIDATDSINLSFLRPYYELSSKGCKCRWLSFSHEKLQNKRKETSSVLRSVHPRFKCLCWVLKNRWSFNSLECLLIWSLLLIYLHFIGVCRTPMYSTRYDFRNPKFEHSESQRIEMSMWRHDIVTLHRDGFLHHNVVTLHGDVCLQTWNKTSQTPVISD